MIKDEEFTVHELHCNCFKLFHGKCYNKSLLGKTCLDCGKYYFADYCYVLGELVNITCNETHDEEFISTTYDAIVELNNINNITKPSVDFVSDMSGNEINKHNNNESFMNLNDNTLIKTNTINTNKDVNNVEDGSCSEQFAEGKNNKSLPFSLSTINVNNEDTLIRTNAINTNNDVNNVESESCIEQFDERKNDQSLPNSLLTTNVNINKTLSDLNSNVICNKDSSSGGENTTRHETPNEEIENNSSNNTTNNNTNNDVKNNQTLSSSLLTTNMNINKTSSDINSKDICNRDISSGDKNMTRNETLNEEIGDNDSNNNTNTNTTNDVIIDKGESCIDQLAEGMNNQSSPSSLLTTNMNINKTSSDLNSNDISNRDSSPDCKKMASEETFDAMIENNNINNTTEPTVDLLSDLSGKNCNIHNNNVSLMSTDDNMLIELINTKNDVNNVESGCIEQIAEKNDDQSIPSTVLLSLLSTHMDTVNTCTEINSNNISNINISPSAENCEKNNDDDALFTTSINNVQKFLVMIPCDEDCIAKNVEINDIVLPSKEVEKQSTDHVLQLNKNVKTVNTANSRKK